MSELRNSFKIIFCLLSLQLVNMSSADQVVARYNNKELMQSEVETALKIAFEGVLPGGKKRFEDININEKQKIVSQLVQQKILQDALNASGIKNSQSFKQQLEFVKEGVALNIFLENYAKKKLTDKMVNNEYAALVKELKSNDELKVHHILVKDENLARTIFNDIKSGKVTFQNAAKQFSVDPGSKDKNGELGFLSRGQTLPEFEKSMYDLKVGVISNPVKTDFGWHIIKVSEIRKRAIPKFEDVRAQITQSALMKIKQEYFNELSKKANIEILVK